MAEAKKTWPLSLSSPWFEAVKAGKKKYEGRLYNEKTQQYKVGDILVFCHSTDKERTCFRRKIVSMRQFETFETALQELDYTQVVPGVASVAEGVKIYLQFYSLEAQKEKGVVLFELASL